MMKETAHDNVRELTSDNVTAVTDSELDNVSAGANSLNAILVWHNLLGNYGYPISNNGGWLQDSLRGC
ncbi:MAG TPA: hypothetical protein VH678_15405 [Xanthobacteraceae bacterium]